MHAILVALRDLIQDHQAIVAVIVAVLLPIYSYKLWRALFASPSRNRVSSGTLRRTPPKPPVARAPVVADGIKPPEPPRSTSDQGISGYQRAGSAKTVKLPSAAPKGEAPAAPPVNASIAAAVSAPAHADRVEVKTGPGHETTAIKLPSQGEAMPSAAGAPVADSKTGLIRKASRMEELGFHTGTHPDAPGAAGAAAATAPGAGEAPRSQTAELTSILERIDKFLAEDQPAGAPSAVPAAPAKDAEPARDASAAPAAAPEAGETALAKKAPPLWARPDAQDEDVEHPPAPATPPGERPTEKPLDRAADKATEKPADGGQQRLF